MLLDNTDELAFEVEFLSCVVDKKKDFVVVDADSHFCDFVGMHYSKIKQGKLSLLERIAKRDKKQPVKNFFTGCIFAKNYFFLKSDCLAPWLASLCFKVSSTTSIRRPASMKSQYLQKL